MSAFKGLRFLVACLVGFVLLAVVAGQAHGQPLSKANEVLIHFKAQVAPEVLSREAKRFNLQVTSAQAVRQAFMADQQLQSTFNQTELGVAVARFSGQETPQSVAQRVAQSPLVQWAEPNYLRVPFEALPNGPDDTYYQGALTLPGNDNHLSGSVRAWWVDQVHADAVFANHLVTAKGTIIVAIIDSGVRLTHEDLSSKLIAGYDFGSFDNDPSDELGHGTHVAGILDAQANNLLGVPGIAYLDQIKLMPLKVADDYGQMHDYAISSAIVYAADHGARIINMSLGGPDKGQTLESAIDYAHRQGCLIVASAGNSALDWDSIYGTNPIMYPASFNHVVSVAATNSVSARAGYSEYNQYVDLAAPGGDTWTGDPAGMILSTYFLNNSSYETMMGTSMAAPVVSGAAALLFAQDPSRTPDQVEAILTSTADKVDSLTNDSDGYNEFLGWGQVNVLKAVTQSSTRPASTDEKGSYNYPNPFNPAEDGFTNILIPRSGRQAQLTIYNSFGRAVVSMNKQGAEVYSGNVFQWDGRDDRQVMVANGVYFYLLKVDGQVYRNKIALKQ